MSEESEVKGDRGWGIEIREDGGVFWLGMSKSSELFVGYI